MKLHKGGPLMEFKKKIKWERTGSHNHRVTMTETKVAFVPNTHDGRQWWSTVAVIPRHPPEYYRQGQLRT